MTIEQRLEQVEQQNQQMQLQNSLGLRQLFFQDQFEPENYLRF